MLWHNYNNSDLKMLFNCEAALMGKILSIGEAPTILGGRVGELPHRDNDPKLLYWEDLYKRKITDLYIPRKPIWGDWCLLINLKLSLSRLYAMSEERYACRNLLHGGIERWRGLGDRNGNKPYAVWVRNQKEPDKDLADLSAIDLSGRGIATMNIEERLIFGIQYFDKTGEPLDMTFATLCSGSHGNCVPVVYNLGGETIISFCDRGRRDPLFRARRVKGFSAHPK